MQAERIIAVKKIGLMPTIDIEVDNKNHTFYGNGIATSNSHAIEYAEIAYWCAYMKAHFPIHFFCAFLNIAEEKIKPQEEIQELIEDARIFNIDIYPPIITEPNFTMTKNGIYFGLKDVKDIGNSHINKLLNNIHNIQTLLGKNIKEWSWFQILMHLGEITNKTVFNNLIAVGAFMQTGLSRQSMLHEYAIWNKITQKEKNIIIERSDSLLTGLQYILTNQATIKTRIETIKGLLSTLTNPPYETEDTLYWITNIEQEILGIPISCNKTDSINSALGNTSCKEFSDGKNEKEMSLAVEISGVREHIIKSGKNAGQKMGFITIKDTTGSCDATIFSNLWDSIKNILYKGNLCLIYGYRSDRNSLIIKKIKEI